MIREYHLGIRIDDSLKEDLQKLADKDNRSLADYARLVLVAHVNIFGFFTVLLFRGPSLFLGMIGTMPLSRNPLENSLISMMAIVTQTRNRHSEILIIPM
tara:strand:- start:361 stop:660 length:300 start_codon:yes stop_codon:yes gene_type:complete